MAIAENKLQEELCKDCIYKQRIHENMLYCPFGHCLWQEYSIAINGKIKTINYINRFSNCRKSVAVYVTKKVKHIKTDIIASELVRTLLLY